MNMIMSRGSEVVIVCRLRELVRIVEEGLLLSKASLMNKASDCVDLLFK